MGALGVVVFFGGKYGYKALVKLYDDMKAQHKEQLDLANKREDKLMKFLDEKNKSDAKVASTLDNICNEMGCMSRRLEDVEKVIKKDENS
jgi:hypothetical protein